MLSETNSWLATPGLFAAAASSHTADPWLYAPHLRRIDDALLDAARGDARILVNLPPRHGKSSIVSKYFPAWYLHSYPDRRVVVASYESEKASEWGAAARLLVNDYSMPLGIQIRADSSARHRWHVDGHEGGMLTTGVGGALTGYGANVLIIDDPHKGPDDANSQVYRDRAWDWFQSVALTRLEPGGSVILIQTRWHEDDLTGRILEDDPTGWQRLTYPAIATEADDLGREPGDALWPTRWPLERLSERRRVLSPYWWNALYQQAPSPPGGTDFKREWFRHYTIDESGYRLSPVPADPDPRPLPLRSRRFATVDTATSLRDSADYTVIATWASAPGGHLLLVDLVHARLEAPDIPPAMRRVWETHHPAYFLVEKEAAGQPVIQAAVRDHLPVREIRARDHGDKWARSQAAVARMAMGMIAWPRHMRDLEEQLAAFPYGAHDDMVDAVSYAAIHQASFGGPARVMSAADVRIPTRGA